MTRFSRRQILKTFLIATGAIIFSEEIFRKFRRNSNPASFPTRLLGPTSAAGHKLRDGFSFPSPSDFKTTDVLIVGGGMAGLSAAWKLQKNGVERFQILELESEVGGNSRFGENSVSKYPWGAHYLTLLNEEATDARELYEDFGIITGQKNGRPVYNEYFLCQAPHERLYIYDKWQEGLLPKVGASPEDETHAKAFFVETERLKFQKGKDGKYLFNIPLDLSSKDAEIVALDQVTMEDYLLKKGWTSKSLHWYVNYCCRDDYGTPLSQTSAWAGLHYFCARRGHTEGVEGSGTLTWPEGNGWLVEKLRNRLAKQITPNSMAFQIEERGHQVIVDVWNESTQSVTRWTAKSAILSTPRFLVPHLSAQLKDSQSHLATQLSYAPWMVANITLKNVPSSAPGAPLSWDNVFFQSNSLGYVVATHQRPAIHVDQTVFTYYLPLDHAAPAVARREAAQRTADDWKKQIIADLSVAHPDINELIESMDIWIWGHAMVRPIPGFIWSETRTKMKDSVGRIHFAHSDMSGISIFEEANHHGVRAANEVLKNDLG